MNRYSLRTRLVAVAVALVAFAVTATGIATYVALQSFLFSRLDDQVAAAASGPAPVCYFAESENGGPVGGPNIGVWVGKLDSAGRVLGIRCTSGEPISTILTPGAADARQLAADPGLIRTIHSATGQEYRAVAVPPPPRDPPPTAWTVIALPTSDVSDTLGRLLGLEIVVGVAAVIGTGVLGAAGVRLGMRPLDRVTRTARTVAAELGPDGTGLDRRVPEADPNTEVGQLSEAVNTMLDAVEREYAARYESEQRMRSFLADASHELRTPLTSLRGYAELVRLQGGLDEGARDSLRRIESEGTRMSRLVEDLLTLARSDRGLDRIERVPVDVSDVVEDAVAGLRAAHPDQEVEVLTAVPLPVLGDRDQLLQVVNNVLANAAVHATGGGPIAVRADRQNGEVVVRVADSGPGLEPEQAARVFDRFWRADSARTRVRGGSGLGLSIVRALVTDHGGRVSFHSDVATGTTVTVRLPAARIPGSGPRRGTQTQPP
ncbi:MAG TPA: HAMP domain-containing sensor histidine kinase [Mycobacteriales bacterium]